MVTEEEIAGVRVTSADDIFDAALALRRAVEARLGNWRVASCLSLASPKQMSDGRGGLLATSVFGWTDHDDDRWWRRNRIALESPLPEACRYESEPMWLNDEGVHAFGANPLLSRIDLSNFQQRALCHAALLIPVHLPFGRIGAVSLVPRDRNTRDLSAEHAAHGHDLGHLSRIFITSCARLEPAEEQMPVGIALSKREVECLRWAAAGKTDLEISMIIDRSRATIRFHMHNATTKLDAVSRSHAVFKAASLGYLSPQH